MGLEGDERGLCQVSSPRLRYYICIIVYHCYCLFIGAHYDILAQGGAAIRRCLYTFVARPGQRVKLEFEHFVLAGSSESCDIEYIDIYSEVRRFDEDILESALGGRYCGTVAPKVRISLHNILKVVLHSRASNRDPDDFGFKATYSFIPEDQYIAGDLIPSTVCSYIIDSTKRPSGMIYSPTYPGSYPRNMHCSYLLRGQPGERIRVFFNDFDVFFGGEHCPYDSVTIYDGSTPSSPIIRKVCGLQQRMEVYSMSDSMLIHFNTTNPAKADPRGFIMEYEFSSRFVNVKKLLGAQTGVTHVRGTECDIRVESNRETTHTISSPNYPNAYPPNTTCSYIIHGLQGDQNLEKVILTFDAIAVLSYDTTPTMSPSADDIACPSAWVGIAISEANMKAVLSSTDDSTFDVTLCERISDGSTLLGPYISGGPRMVIQFGTTDTRDDGATPLGFKATIEFKTDFGVTGRSLGTSNECKFLFSSSSGFFNSPRYPANYPLDTNCTYFIVGSPGKEIVLHFEQFALQDEPSCDDWLDVYDVFHEGDIERLELKQRYCSNVFPGPLVSSFGSHEMRVVFSSSSKHSANGFKALFEIRDSRLEDVPSGNQTSKGGGTHRCGGIIEATDEATSGHLASPNYPIKYNKDTHCDWRIVARQGKRILLKMDAIDVEGEMADDSASCQKAVIRVEGAPRTEYCGQHIEMFEPLLSKENAVRISFLTAPDKVNGLKGFNIAWTEVEPIADGNESHCATSSMYLCTYSKLCIDAKLRCDGHDNCGYSVQDDSDEQHCSLKESSADRTVVIAAVFCGAIFLFICGFFFYLFKKKLEKKKKKKRKDNSRHRQRQPYRQQRPVSRQHNDPLEISSPATSRFVHHDATGMFPPIQLHQTAYE